MFKTYFASLLLASVTLPVFGQYSSDQINYILHCQGCHRADGSGLGMDVPDLHLYLNDFLALPGGRAYLVQVPGSANAPLSAEQLAGVLNWIVTSMPGATPPRDFEPFTEQEVTDYKATRLVEVDVGGERQRLIELISISEK